MRSRSIYVFLVFTFIAVISCNEIKETQSIEGNWKVISLKTLTNFEDPPNFLINLETMKIAGFSGCNRFFGDIIKKNKNLTFQHMGGTRKACIDFEVENTFITAISEVKSFKFNKNKLLLLSESNDIVMILKANNPE